MANSKLKTTFAILFIPVLMLFSCTKNQYLPHWFLGKWKAEFNGISVVETWEKHDEMYTGTTVWDDHGLQSVEKLKLYFDDDKLVYQININDTDTKFICSNLDNDTLIFINNKNDYPKRIIYTRPIKKEMKVWIDNFQNDSHTSTFYFEKK